MFSRSFRHASLGTLLSISLMGLVPTMARAQGRQDLERAFSALRGSTPGTRIGAATINNQPVCGAVKMWAVKANAAGEEISGPLNLNLHDWEPDDYLYLYFESATPILVYLYQIYPETGFPNSGQQKTVLPDTNFPESFKALPAGATVRLPILLKLDHNREDEAVAFAFQALDLPAGGQLNTGNPTLDNPPVSTSQQANAASGAEFETRVAYAAQLGQAGLQGPRYAIPEGARVSAVAAGTAPGGGAVAPGGGGVAPGGQGSGDDYKAITAFANRQAFLKLVFHK